MKIDFKGLFPATVLPMTEDAQIDEPALRAYMRHVADTTIHGVAINVDTGETAHLSHEERVRVLQIVVDEIGDRLPVIAGLPAQYTDQAVAYGRDYKAAGASAFLVFPLAAYQGAPLDAEMVVRYHSAVGDTVGLPLVLFNLLPALGGVLLPAEIIGRLCNLAPVVAIKDASFEEKIF
ncbi:MAG: dihydrodipicolinate synthase family protein, partial [Chloroflexi bacterium]